MCFCLLVIERFVDLFLFFSWGSYFYSMLFIKTMKYVTGILIEILYLMMIFYITDTDFTQLTVLLVCETSWITVEHAKPQWNYHISISPPFFPCELSRLLKFWLAYFVPACGMCLGKCVTVVLVYICSGMSSCKWFTQMLYAIKINYYNSIRFEAFTATKYNKILPGSRVKWLKVDKTSVPLRMRTEMVLKT
jgi:hypothetical protein